MVCKAIYTAFQQNKPEAIKAIEDAKNAGVLLPELIKLIETKANEFNTKDGGNNLILLAEHIYSQTQLN